MTRLLFGLLFIVLLSGPAFAHGAGHVSHGGAPRAAATEVTDPGDEAPGPPGHRHDASVSFHCGVSASCAPLFLLSGGSALPLIAPGHMAWRIAADTLRRNPVLERDPPVPRV
jgi:hypothetical protein